MSQNNPPARRPPRKKLKMPLFGGMGGGNKNNDQVDLGGRHFSTLLFIVVALGLIGQALLPSLWAEKVYDTEDELRDLAIDGALRKKYTDASDPSEIHYLLMIKQKDGTRRKIDLYQANPMFFDQVAVPQRLFKKPGTLGVRVTRFSLPDTIIQINFNQN